MTEWQEAFLAELYRRGWTASVRILGPQVSQAQNSARQTCKRRGWAEFNEGYWHLTRVGMEALEDHWAAK